MRDPELACSMSGTVVTQCKTRQYLKLRKEEVEMEKQGRKGKQGDSVSQHRWQQSQHTTRRSLAAAKGFAGFLAKPHF